MAMRILWPNLPARLVPVATEAVGSGFELVFREKFEDVSDEQWAKADAAGFFLQLLLFWFSSVMQDFKR